MISRPVILACSGPSLNVTAVRTSGLPIAAISTAIRCIPNPEYWIFWDGRSSDYRDEGDAAFANPAVMKIVRDKFRERHAHHPNVRFVRWNTGVPPVPLFDKKQELVVPRARSIFVAIKWLVRRGFNELIFAGCDLRMTDASTYAHGAKRTRREMLEANESMRREGESLAAWTAEAAKYGVRLLSWSPVSVINDFMPPYEPGVAYEDVSRTAAT